MRGTRAPFLTVVLVGLAAKAAEAEPSVPDAGAHSDGAGAAAPVTQGKPSAPAGESIPDIDQIVENLDRQAPVSAVAFSPNGELIASGSDDHRVRIWQPATGRLIRRLEGHSSAVTAVAFSPDGSFIASASNDRTVRLWDAHSGQLLRTLQGHVYHVYAVAFDPRRRWLASASWDKTIQLWDMKSGELVRKLVGHSAAVRAIDFSGDGKLLASGSDDRTVRLWSAETGKELKALTGHTAPVNAVRFAPDGRWLYSGSADQTVQAWPLPDGGTARKIADCGAPVLSLTISANGQILGGACGAAGAVLWDVASSTEIRRGRRDAEPRAIAFSFDGRMVASAGKDAAIAVEDVATGRLLIALSAKVARLDAVAFNPDGSMLATASRDRRILLWQDAGDRKTLARVLVVEQGPARGLGFSPDGNSLAAGDGPKLAIWDLADGGAVRTLTGHEGVINDVIYAPDGRTIASASDDATVGLWDLKKNSPPKLLRGHRAAVKAVAIAPDGKVLASASDDQTVRIWDIATGRSLAVLGSHRGPVTSLAFSSDGKLLATGSQDRTIDVWLHAKAKLLKGMRKELPAGVVALAAHGQRIASATSDGVISLWDLAANRPAVQTPATAAAPSALAFSPDGSLASASRDGVLRIWDSKTLERRWSLAGSSRERWFACNGAQTCWRNEDGTLLGRTGPQGAMVPVSPSDEAHRTILVASVDRRKLGDTINLPEGRTVSIPIRIENRGSHPAYWVSVSQSALTTGVRTSLLLIPPPMVGRLEPGASTRFECEVSAMAEYENPQPHSETLRLSVTSASAKTLSVEIPVWVDTPHLRLGQLALLRGSNPAVAASMKDVSMAELRPVRLQGDLIVEGNRGQTVAPITIEQPFVGQDLLLSFPLPQAVRLDRRSRVTLSLRKSTHPVHVWTFTHLPVRIPLPRWFWALAIGSALGLGFVVWRARLYARARPVGRAAKRAGRLAAGMLLRFARVLKAVIYFRSTLGSLGARLQRRGIAVTFFRLQPETQCSHLAQQLGASWTRLSSGRQPVFELRLGPEVLLDLERCLLALPTPDALHAALAELETADQGQDGITVVLSDIPRSEVAARLGPRRRLAVLAKTVMDRVLRAPDPALAFAQAVTEQTDRRAVSLYRSAVMGSQRQPFFGRKSELRRLSSELRTNYLVIGPQGIGKTRLLEQIHRRFLEHPTVECYYLSLANGDLTAALAEALGMPGERLLDILLERLADQPDGKRVLVLCDDADAWASRDAAHGGAQLQTLTLLSQEHPCSFVLAGFLGVLYAARRRRDRKAFGEVVRLENLDTEACTELATLPMQALGLEYAKADVAQHIVEQSAGMPSLLVAICNEIVEHMDPDQSTVGRTEADAACRSEAVARTVTAWRPRFGLPDQRLGALDQAVMLSAVFKTHFTLDDLQSTLADLGVRANATEIKGSASRLVAACVFEQWLGYYHFRVPIFQTAMQKATLARMVHDEAP